MEVTQVQVGVKPTLRTVVRAFIPDMNVALSDGYNDGVHGFRPNPMPALVIAELREEFGFKHRFAPTLTPPHAQHKLDMASVKSVGWTGAHADLSSVEACSWRTDTCTFGCVLNNGNGRYDSVRRAWVWRTELFVRQPVIASYQMGYELGAAVRKYSHILFRPDVNTDMAWHRILPTLGALPNVTTYGYTKNPAVLSPSFGAEGFHYCYSWNEGSNMARVRDHLERGGKVAVVTNRKKNQSVDARTVREFFGVKRVHVADADVTDEWMLRKGAVIGDLTAKGAIRKTIGMTDFVVPIF